MADYTLKQSSYKELAEVITNSPAIQKEVQGILEHGNCYDYKPSLSLTLEARAFCAHTLRSTGEAYLFRTGQPLSTCLYYRYGSSGNAEIFQYMDLPTIQKLTLQRMFNRERARRVDAKFDAIAKVLKANYFAYTLFETYLNELKKPLSGKDALRYMNMVMQLPDKFKMMYAKLIWNHANRTQKVIKEFRDLHGKDHQRPFAVINDRQYKDPNEKYCEFYHIPHRMYQTIMWRHNMPVTAQFFDTNESMFPLYVSGVPRKTQTSKAELQSLVDKISLLNYYNKYVLEDKACPYFRGTKEQLITVMKNCPDGDFEAYRTKLKKVIASFQQTLKDITW